MRIVTYTDQNDEVPICEAPICGCRKMCTDEVPIWKKQNLSVKEAAAYSNIGINTIRKMIDREDCPFILWVGSKGLIKRRRFDEYISQMFSI